MSIVILISILALFFFLFEFLFVFTILVINDLRILFDVSLIFLVFVWLILLLLILLFLFLIVFLVFVMFLVIFFLVFLFLFGFLDFFNYRYDFYSLFFFRFLLTLVPEVQMHVRFTDFCNHFESVVFKQGGVALETQNVVFVKALVVNVAGVFGSLLGDHQVLDLYIKVTFLDGFLLLEVNFAVGQVGSGV